MSDKNIKLLRELLDDATVYAQVETRDCGKEVLHCHCVKISFGSEEVDKDAERKSARLASLLWLLKYGDENTEGGGA